MGQLYELYDNGTLIYNEDNRILSEEKERVKQEINSKRIALFKKGTVNYDGNDFDITDEAQSNIQSTVTSVSAGVPLPAGFMWRTYTNTFVPMDEIKMIDFGAAAMDYVFRVYATAWGKKDYVDANVSSLAVLDAIEEAIVNTGWPSNVYTADV